MTGEFFGQPSRPPACGAAASIRFFFREPPSRGRRLAIFLDRDGVINERIMGGYVTRWEEFRFLEGAPQAIRSLSRLNLPILVISNQAGTAKGLLSRRTLADITTRFVRALGRAGARVDAVYYCPHVDRDACRCRKPKPGLLLQAARDWHLDLGRSVMVGDSLTDIGAARAAGCHALLLRRGAPPAGAVLDPGRIELPLPVVHNLAELPGAVAALLGRVPPVPLPAGP